MDAVLNTWAVKDLKAECAKHGMAQFGSKKVLIQRILDNIPGKRKPGPKPGIAKKATSATKTSGLKSYPIKLGQTQMTSLGLAFVGQGKDGNGNAIFKYKPVGTAKKADSKPVPKKMSTLIDDADDDEDEVDDDGSECGSERSDDLMDGDTFQEYQDRLVDRLADRRVPKKLLVELIKAFDPEQKLSSADKTELAERAVEQLMYETEDEEE